MSSEPSRRPLTDLFLISVLILFLELACIRWFPAHVLYLTFFTNVMLLACFVGMSIGCLAASRQTNFLRFTPLLVLLAVLAAYGVELLRLGLGDKAIAVTGQKEQLVFFGTERDNQDISKFVIPIEALGGVFFTLVALAMVGPGQVLGRALTRVPNRIQAYTVNITGSLVGIVLFGLCSYMQLRPLWWFLPIVLCLAYFLYERPLRTSDIVSWAFLLVVIVGANGHSGSWTFNLKDKPEHKWEFFWSPYYRIDYEPQDRMITVNQIGHQVMVTRDRSDSYAKAYALPHVMLRDSRRAVGETPQPLDNVLVIGAGSGNDLSRSLQFGAKHIDAVEIDPVIQKLGAQDHPDKPYDDPRVELHLNDGRNFLRTTERTYDLIIYALVDSLVLHSGYSNIRLESYLFTKQAFDDVKRCLKPGGTFVMYNYFRQGWIVDRLRQGLQEAFGTEPVVFLLPHQAEVKADEELQGFYTAIFVGPGAVTLQRAFDKHKEYWVQPDVRLTPESPNGFLMPQAERDKLAAAARGEWNYNMFAPARVIPSTEPLRIATDDWPFLYLRRPMVPWLSLRGAALMGGLTIILLFLFAPRGEAAGRGVALPWRMFFLGAGFMLVETKAVVHLALLFGSTWMVNSIVFFAILVMILFANMIVLAVRPRSLWPYYIGLFATLAANAVVSLDVFLGLSPVVQIVGSCLLVFAPIFFAGVIFATSFAQTTAPDRAFGFNIAGAMAGGLAEYTSMLLGFQYLVFVALGLYALSAITFGSGKEALVSGPEKQREAGTGTGITAEAG
jgi:SAM-dependent methyltransferase